MNKSQARAAIKALGYTVLFDTGQCGDGSYGSREYYRAPDAKLNEHGFPTEKHGTISRWNGKWYVSDFSKHASKA